MSNDDDRNPLGDYLAGFTASLSERMAKPAKDTEQPDLFTVDRVFTDGDRVIVEGTAQLFTSVRDSQPNWREWKSNTLRESMLMYLITHNPETLRDIVETRWLTDGERALLKQHAPHIALPGKEDSDSHNAESV